MKSYRQKRNRKNMSKYKGVRQSVEKPIEHNKAKMDKFECKGEKCLNGYNIPMVIE